MKAKLIILLFPFLALISYSLQEVTETDSPVYLLPNSMVIKLDSAQGEVYRDFKIIVPEKQLPLSVLIALSLKGAIFINSRRKSKLLALVIWS